MKTATLISKYRSTLLCTLLFLTFNVHAQTNRVDVGKSYANVSKRSTGGTFQPGDTIEVRVTLAVLTLSGTATIIDSVRMQDNVPANTTYIPGSTRISTNEGITYKGNFTDAADADQGQHIAGAISIVMGRGATGISGGRIKSDSSRPSFYNNTCIMMACYRVRINPSANYGDTLVFNSGSITYRMIQPAGATIVKSFPTARIYIYQNNAACSNGRDVSAASDSLGTFASGTVQNRAAALAFTTTYVKQNLAANSPQDYNYSIVNNLSPTASTIALQGYPSMNRVFTIWDLGGDHTNASNPTLGNPPTAAGSRGGYMVVVNASYKTDTAYRETLNNLCPDTYYEFSAWFRNICARCSCDSTGKGSSSLGFIPAPGNDSSGVRPNISFIIDGLMYYTSGDISYNRSAPWVKYGFTFRTKPGQTSANFLIQNNSPGGGGNDWALDDIRVSHCGPSLFMNYNPYVLGCSAAPFYVELHDTIRYLFSNSYLYYKWQKSNVGGTIWTDMTGPGTSGIGVSTLVNGQYQYVASLPPFLATYADSGTYYRVLVATSPVNLASTNCSYSDGTSTMIKVINCMNVLNSNMIQFRGNIQRNLAVLNWSSVNETNISHYDIEKSTDGIRYAKIGSLISHPGLNNIYSYDDTEPLSDKNYYRLKMIDREGLFKFSNVILLTTKSLYESRAIESFFKDNMKAEVIVPSDGWIHISIVNEQGNVVFTKKQWMLKGSNMIQVENLSNGSPGLYVFSTMFNNENRRLKFIKIK